MEFFEGLFTLGSLGTLLMLVLLQAVLGFDNLLYIAIESKRVEEQHQSSVRRWGIGLAILLRIVLLLILSVTFEYLKTPFFKLHLGEWIGMDVTVRSLVVLVGGAFIIYTATKEILHMLSLHDLGGHTEDKPKRSPGSAITWIVIMNLVFSFDSILSAMALTHNFIVMSIAIVISGLMMMFLADHVTHFLQKNRMYEVLGLFILFIVGIMLVTEGGELSHLTLAGKHVEAMTKSTFYFVLVVLVIVDIVQSRYQKKLLAQAAREVR
ncbi:MAG: tellurium resistance protein TerC [Pirellulaceae bacterium]